MRRIVVQEADFDIAAETTRLAGTGVGGIASFIGTVRAERGDARCALGAPSDQRSGSDGAGEGQAHGEGQVDAERVALRVIRRPVTGERGQIRPEK